MKTILTTQQATTFLSEHIGPAVNSVETLHTGTWSQAFGYVYMSRQYVVRFSKYENDFLKDELAAAFAGPALPIPKTIEIGKAFEGYFAITERVHGTMLEALDSSTMQRIVPSALAMLDAMREADTSMIQGYGRWDGKGAARFASWQEYLAAISVDDPESKMHGWSAALAASPIGAGSFNRVLSQLIKLLPFCPNDQHLIHGDLLYRNVLTADDRISGVIDWGNAMQGDFLYDVAWLSFWEPWYAAMNNIDWAQVVKDHLSTLHIDLPSFSERLLCYKLHIGLDAQAYNAYCKRWAQLKDVTDKTLALIW